MNSEDIMRQAFWEQSLKDRKKAKLLKYLEGYSIYITKLEKMDRSIDF
jgi:hypothetical protein